MNATTTTATQSKTATATPALVGKRGAAALCGLGVSTWERYMAAGWVPRPVRIGSCVRWRVGDLTAWIEAGCPRPGQN